jgi:hypothetical protein
MSTTILAIILTWACPSGLERKTQINHSYPKEFDAALLKYKELEAGLDILTKDFNGEVCTLTSIRGGHITTPKKGVK